MQHWVKGKETLCKVLTDARSQRGTLEWPPGLHTLCNPLLPTVGGSSDLLSVNRTGQSFADVSPKSVWFCVHPKGRPDFILWKPWESLLLAWRSKLLWPELLMRRSHGKRNWVNSAKSQEILKDSPALQKGKQPSWHLSREAIKPRLLTQDTVKS